jgi:Phage virion morphogenesis family
MSQSFGYKIHDNVLVSLLRALRPSELRNLLKGIGRDVSREQGRRVASQRNPDGSKFEPRKRPAQKPKTYRIRYRNAEGIVSEREVTGVVYFRKKKFEGFDSKRKTVRTFRKDRVLEWISKDPSGSTRKRGNGTMFRQMHKAKHLRVQGLDTNSVSLGFSGRTETIARVHQFGLQANKNSRARMPIRELLGVSDKTEKVVMDSLVKHLLK